MYHVVQPSSLSPEVDLSLGSVVDVQIFKREATSLDRSMPKTEQLRRPSWQSFAQRLLEITSSWKYGIFRLFFSTFIHSFIEYFVRLFIHSFIHPLIVSLIHLLVRSFIHSLIHSLVRSFVRSSVRSFVRSFTHSLTHSP